ncbi:hypothetical protein [Gorillibacterium sp. sgz500922]|uniref:hyaluronate lyase N-terminal domain-containing protein n=1 Tax=Gorillibacterium sp. sgz500922 TaxID=3446694 RepID=UPI003F66A792
MARKVLIQIRRGLETAIGTLAVGELGYCTDTSKLYIGTASGNVLLVAAQTAGDMLKSIYDTNNDGKVDFASAADSVPWSGVSGKPTALPAAGGAADGINFLDTRTVADKPKDLVGKRLSAAFKSPAAMGNPPVQSGSFVYVLRVIGWSSNESSGGWPIELAFGSNGLAFRPAIDADTWGAWTKLANNGAMTWGQLKGV